VDALQTDGARAPAIVIRGAGTRAFSAGFDLSRLDGTAADVRADDSIGAAVTAIRSCPAPVIACIRGHCHGAAVEIALSCDLRVAGDDLQMSVKAVGLGRAQDFLLAMPVLDAGTALAWGLLTEVSKGSELDSRVMHLARGLAAAPRSAVAGTKATFRLLEQQTGSAASGKADALRAETSATPERRNALREAKERLRKT
jgi:enoyl-CoA hydratase